MRMFRPIHPIFMLICKNPRGMRGAIGNLARSARRLILFGVVLGLACPELALGAQPPPSAPVILGTYKIVVRGFLTGPVAAPGQPLRGQASASGGSVSFSIQVVDDNGNRGNFTAQCTLSGDHFKGTGFFMNATAVIEGRLESADPGLSPGKAPNPTDPLNPTVVTDAHLGATFRLSNGHSGRIAGVMIAGGGGGG